MSERSRPAARAGRRAPSQRPAARLAALDPRLHYAARAEDRLNQVVAATLRRRGWVPRVLGYTGYGSSGLGQRSGGPVVDGSAGPVADGAAGSGWVRVLGRVLVSRPGTGQPPAPEGGPGALGSLGSLSPLRGWRSFLSAPAAGVEVDIRVGTQVHRVTSGRGGYLDVRLPSSLPAGVARVRMDVVGAGDAAAEADVVIVSGDTRFGVISDIDDTVITTALPRPFIAAYNTFVLRERARRPVPGMAELLTSAVAAHPGSPIVYVSTGAWNTAPVLARFLSHHGYPRGPMLLTDWGPTNTGWFRSGVEHKRYSLRRLAEEFPNVQWLLVGDDGQHDPTTYANFAADVPASVRAIAIRQLTATEQVLSHAAFAPVGAYSREVGGSSLASGQVPQVRGPDGDSLVHQLEQLDLL